MSNMKTILTLIAATFLSTVISGCTTKVGASVGHEGETHGIAAKGSTERGVSAGVRAY